MRIASATYAPPFPTARDALNFQFEDLPCQLCKIMDDPLQEHNVE